MPCIYSLYIRCPVIALRVRDCGVIVLVKFDHRVRGFLQQMEHFLTDMSNLVEHQKLNEVAAVLPPGWVFGVQFGLRQTQALIKIKKKRKKMEKIVPLRLLFHDIGWCWL